MLISWQAFQWAEDHVVVNTTLRRGREQGDAVAGSDEFDSGLCVFHFLHNVGMEPGFVAKSDEPIVMEGVASAGQQDELLFGQT